MKPEFLLLLILAACTHAPIKAEKGFQKFPPAFYTEQVLTFRSPNEQKKLQAQLRREPGSPTLDLVLADNTFGMVLARVAIAGEVLKTVYIAPQIDQTQLPLQAISRAIRQLYEAKEFTLQDGVYVLPAANRFYEYRLSSIQGTAGCLYPERIDLRFTESAYELRIDTDSFTCLPEP